VSPYGAQVFLGTTVPLNGHENVSDGTEVVLWLFVVFVAFLLVAGWFRRDG